MGAYKHSNENENMNKWTTRNLARTAMMTTTVVVVVTAAVGFGAVFCLIIHTRIEMNIKQLVARS